jgi:hypothetical protein
LRTIGLGELAIGIVWTDNKISTKPTIAGIINAINDTPKRAI